MKKILTLILLTSLSFNAKATIELVLSSEKGKVEFLAKGWPALLKINGKGEGATGKVVIKDNKASGELKLNLSSFETGISLRDTHMKDNYLEVAKFPVATLTLKKIELPKNLKGKAKFTGNLNLHGVNKPINGKLSFKGTKKGINKVKAEFDLKISDFDIAIPSFKGVTVAEDVKVNVSSEIEVINKNVSAKMASTGI